MASKHQVLWTLLTAHCQLNPVWRKKRRTFGIVI